MSQRSGGLPPQTSRHRMLDGETRDCHCCRSPADTTSTVQSYRRADTARQIQTPAETVMPSVLALLSLNKKIRITSLQKNKYSFLFFKLAFGSFASKSPVESPISNELLPLFFAGDMERERGTKGSSCED